MVHSVQRKAYIMELPVQEGHTSSPRLVATADRPTVWSWTQSLSGLLFPPLLNEELDHVWVLPAP